MSFYAGTVALLRGRALRARLDLGRAAARPSRSLLLVAIAALAGCGQTPPADESATAAAEPKPYTPPNIKLATPAEIHQVIDAERGNVIVINFWATWCPPCIKEMPELTKFWRDFDGKGVRFLSISADHHSTKDSAVVPFMNSYEIPFPVRIMYVDNPDEIAEELPLTWEDRQWDGVLPATFIFNRDGKQVWSTVGEVTRDLLAEKVKPLLAPAE
jgi:thiol-disulfide isomerase/thioredoxin